MICYRAVFAYLQLKNPPAIPVHYLREILQNQMNIPEVLEDLGDRRDPHVPFHLFLL
jgi:hypothetical protein